MISLDNYHRIKAVLSELDATLPPLDPAEEQIALWKNRLHTGTAALAPDDFPADWAASALAAILQAEQSLVLPGEEVQEMVELYWKDQILSTAAARLPIDQAVITMYIHLSCQWSLRRLAAVVAGHAAFDAWGDCRCPACGDVPAVSYFAADGTRSLVCGACQTAWRYKRIGCAFCGEQNHENLRTLSVEEYTGWSIKVCRTCRGAIKTADLRILGTTPDWNEAQLMLLPLDFAVDQWLNKPTDLS